MTEEEEKVLAQLDEPDHDQAERHAPRRRTV
jgi:hypothetical protein